jgi:hypothetical protein
MRSRSPLAGATFGLQPLSDTQNKAMRHRPAIAILFLAAAAISASCKKHNPGADTSIQQKWQLISLNGEAIRYVGKPADYWDFHNNDTLIQFIGGNYDTLKYQLINGGKTVVIEPFVLAFVDTLDIKTLTSSQLILSGIGRPGYAGLSVHILDSLRR